MTNPVLSTPQLARTLREVLTAPDTITDDGIGLTITEAIAKLAVATTRLAASIERFCDMNDGE
jgi:hypothetical protein